MIEVIDAYGKRHFLASAAIAEILEAGASSQWHGIMAYIKTFDGRTIEVRETASEIAAQMGSAKS